MKTLTDPVITLKGDEITIVAKIVDLQFNGMLTTRVSHGYLHPEHNKHPRRVQSSNVAIFIESPRSKFVIPNDVIAAIAAVADPATSFAPVFKKSSKPGNVKVISELPVTYQWQISDNAFPQGTFPPPAAVWTDIAGATAATLDESKIEVNKWIRCQVSNAAGITISQPAQKK